MFDDSVSTRSSRLEGRRRSSANSQRADRPVSSGGQSSEGADGKPVEEKKDTPKPIQRKLTKIMETSVSTFHMCTEREELNVCIMII
jgi:hypothetical protein